MTSVARSRTLAAPLLATVALAAASLLTACNSSNRTEPAADFDLEPFKQLARQASCTDVRNRLFLIDGEMVFWQASGNCADASYLEKLFGRSIDEVLCVLQDSIAGPQKFCADASRATLFEILIAHPDEPDLGLGAHHSVELIPF